MPKPMPGINLASIASSSSSTIDLPSTSTSTLIFAPNHQLNQQHIDFHVNSSKHTLSPKSLSHLTKLIKSSSTPSSFSSKLHHFPEQLFPLSNLVASVTPSANDTDYSFAFHHPHHSNSTHHQPQHQPSEPATASQHLPITSFRRSSTTATTTSESALRSREDSNRRLCNTWSSPSATGSSAFLLLSANPNKNRNSDLERNNHHRSTLVGLKDSMHPAMLQNVAAAVAAASQASAFLGMASQLAAVHTGDHSLAGQLVGQLTAAVAGSSNSSTSNSNNNNHSNSCLPGTASSSSGSSASGSGSSGSGGSTGSNFGNNSLMNFSYNYRNSNNYHHHHNQHQSSVNNMSGTDNSYHHSSSSQQQQSLQHHNTQSSPNLQNNGNDNSNNGYQNNGNLPTVISTNQPDQAIGYGAFGVVW